MDERNGITDDNEMDYRERATALLDEFAQQAKNALRNAGIGIDLIFVVGHHTICTKLHAKLKAE
jgi:hypothetical protein